jgi:PAS domain S-box-containing protein
MMTRTARETLPLQQWAKLLLQDVVDYTFVFLDRDGQVVEWNTGVARIMGYTASEIVGEHFAPLYPRAEIDSGASQRVLERVVAHGRYEGEAWRVRNDGTRFWARVVITALRDELGVLVGFCKVTHDLTQRKKAQDEIAQLTRDLEQRTGKRKETDLELEALCDAVAHDLRVIARGGGKLDVAIEQLLDFAQTIGRPLRRVEFDMEATVREAWAEIGAPPGVELDVSRLPLGYGDPGLLKRTWIYLLSHAAKRAARGDRPKVEVVGHDAGNALIYRIRDDGPVFDGAGAKKIFDLFVGLREGEEGDGAAVGLAVAQRAVKRHHGSIWTEDAQVTFSLPARP